MILATHNTEQEKYKLKTCLGNLETLPQNQKQLEIQFSVRAFGLACARPQERLNLQDIYIIYMYTHAHAQTQGIH